MTSSRTWLALATISAMLVASIVWGFVGSVPESVVGQGILLRGGGVLELAPLQGGRSQLISRFRLVTSSRSARSLRVCTCPKLPTSCGSAVAGGTATRGTAAHERYNRDNQQLQEASLTQQIRNLEQAIETSRQDVATMEEKVATQQQLTAQGLLTKQALVTTRQGADAIRQKMREYDQLITRNRADLIRTRTDASKLLESVRAKVADAERELAVVERETREASEVVSPYTGRILEVSGDAGRVCARGETRSPHSIFGVGP
ncbi:MAG: hypothetical protein U5K74_01085 [Gemmatimonadaceae bacterium]|nr:hypothetical protein [Gemmatimonadaceae bacterium]